MHGVPGMGKANVVASRRASFKWRKARSASSVHLNGVLFFFVNRVSGSAMVANKASIVGRKSEEGSNISQAMRCRPVSDGL